MGWLQVLEKEDSSKEENNQKDQILIIDDNPDITDLIYDYLSQFGFRVFTANSGEEGLKIFKRKAPKILIVDLKMPGMSGLDVLKKIRQTDEETEVIILTGFKDTNAIIEALRNRASDFIVKPVDLETLKLTVDKSLRRLELVEQVKNYTQRLENLLQSVRDTKEYLQNILESSPQAIVTYDLSGNILEWNSAAERITGYRASEVKGKSLKEILTTIDMLINPADDGIETAVKGVVGQIITKWGDLRYISRHARMLVDANRKPIGVIENFFDVTEQVYNDQLLEKRYLQLQTINEIGKKIASCNDLSEIAQFVSDKLVKSFFESTQLSIFFYKPSLKKLVLEAFSGYNIEELKSRFPLGTSFDPEQGVIGQVFKSRKEIIAKDVTRLPFAAKCLAEETQSQFAFPIRFKESVFGVLNIENTEKINLDAAERFMLEAIAEYLGIAKDRIELMDRIKEQNIQLEKQADELRKALNKVEKQKQIIEDQHKKLITDLQKAADFQKSLLPESIPRFEDLQLETLYLPSSQLGGDFYDIMDLDDRYAALIIADASGHGVAAAMLSAMFKMTLHKYSAEILNPALVLEKMNKDFCSVLQTGEFFSAFLAVLDRQENVLRFANAGHPRPLLYDYKSGEINELDTEGVLLGIVDLGVGFTQKEIKLNGKCRLFIYTDGLNEAVNEKEEQFGMQRLKELLVENANNSTEVLIENTRKSLYNYTGSNDFADDVTILVMDKL